MKVKYSLPIVKVHYVKVSLADCVYCQIISFNDGKCNTNIHDSYSCQCMDDSRRIQ